MPQELAGNSKHGLESSKKKRKKKRQRIKDSCQNCSVALKSKGAHTNNSCWELLSNKSLSGSMARGHHCLFEIHFIM